MDQHHQKLPTLSARGTLVVDLLRRFGLIFAAALQGFVPSLTSDAGRKCLDRLTKDGWLTKHHFAGGVPYYVLSDAACHRLELKRNGRALRQRPLIKRTLVLLHFSDNQQLKLLTAIECREYLPSLYHRGAASQFFVDAERSSLGWLCLDDGKQPLRIYSKVQQTAAKKRTSVAVRQLTTAGQFRLLVLTTSESKAEQLTALFEKRPIQGMPVEIAFVPNCAQLILSQLSSEPRNVPLQ